MLDEGSTVSFLSCQSELSVAYPQGHGESVEVLISETSKESETFHGAYIGTGAQRTVVGEKQARAYCTDSRIPFELSSPGNVGSYKFGERKHVGLGILNVRIPMDNLYFLDVPVVVVDVNVPILIGLDEMQQF